MVLIPEIAVEVDQVIRAVENAYIRGKTHCIIVIAEGFEPKSTVIAERIAAMDLGFDTRVTILGHIQRGGKPTAFDRMLSTRFGVHAVRLLLEGKTGTMTAMQGREINPISLEEATSNQKALSDEYFGLATMLAK
jgi:6-phosphofructokinase 1